MRNGNHFYHLNTIKKSFDETFKCFYVSRPFIFFVCIFFCPGFLQVKSETESEKTTAQDDPVIPPQAQSWITVTRYVSIWRDMTK